MVSQQVSTAAAPWSPTQIIPHSKCPLLNAVLKMIVDISQLDKVQEHNRMPILLLQVRLLLPLPPPPLFPRLPPLQVRPLP
jgi:hypothetical protein